MNRIIFLISVFVCINDVLAGLLIDPFINYRIGKIDYTVANTGTAIDGDYEYAVSGYDYGARIGGTIGPLMIGLHYSMGVMGEDELSTGPSAISTADLDEYDTTMTGGFIGMAIPLVRVWATYYFDISWEDNNDVGSAIGTEYTASGFALGAGFTGLPFLSINLEYRMYAVDEISMPNGTVTNLPTNLSTEYEITEYVAGLSVPLDF